MKKILVSTGILLALSLLGMGCNKAGKLNQKSEFKPPSGPVAFKVKWPKGERVEQDIDDKIKMAISVPGQTAPMNQDMTFGMAYGMTVLDTNADGGSEVEVDFLSARMGMKTGDKVMMAYDSTKKETPGQQNPAGDVFSKMIGAKIQYYLNATNGIDRMEGMDDLINRLSAGQPSAATSGIKDTFNEGFFRQMMSANLLLPSKPVQPGDTWPVQLDMPAGGMGDMKLNFNFTFQDWEKHGVRDCARLDFDGTIQGAMDTKSPAGSMSISIQDGTLSGTSWFDPELGIMIDTSINENFNMLMKMPQNPRAKPGPGAKMQTMTNQMNQVISIKLVSVK